MAELFQTTVPNINQHLKAIYDEGELVPEATIKRYLIVQTEGQREVTCHVDHYNLETSSRSSATYRFHCPNRWTSSSSGHSTT
jgi:hypothetical protein